MIAGWLLLVLGGFAAGASGMFVYSFSSPQEKLKNLKGEIAAARSSLLEFDGEFEGFSPLFLRHLGLSVRRFLLTLLPTGFALLPVFLVILLMPDYLLYRMPLAGEPLTVANHGKVSVVLEVDGHVPVEVRPGVNEITWPGAGRRISLSMDGFSCTSSDDYPVLRSVPEKCFVDSSGRQRGAAEGGELLRLELPDREYLPFGPGLLRGWEGVFFPALAVASLTLKLLLKIE